MRAGRGNVVESTNAFFWLTVSVLDGIDPDLTTSNCVQGGTGQTNT